MGIKLPSIKDLTDALEEAKEQLVKKSKMSGPVFWRKHGGKDAKVHWIKGKNVTEARQNHDFKDMYLSHRKEFDEAYSDSEG